MSINNVKGGQDGGGNTSPILKSCLLDKRVKIRPVPVKNRITIKSDNPEVVRSEQIMLTGTSRSIILKEDSATNRLINPFTLAEREFLEDMLGVNLDVNKPKDLFLKTPECRITVVKDIDDIDEVYTELNLNNPIDYIKYKICLFSNEVAPSKKPQYTMEEIFYIDDEVQEEIVEIAGNKVEDECLKFLFSIEDSKTKLYNFLRTFAYTYRTGVKVDKDSKQEWIYGQIKELIRDKKHRTQVHELITLIKKDEAAYETKLLIQDSIMVGEIVHTPNNLEYKLPDSGEVLGKSIKEVEAYLRNPVNQLVRERLKSQVKLNLN